MRTKLLLFLGFIHCSLIAAPLMDSKPDAAYFEKFHPVKAPAITSLALKTGDRLAICGDSITEQKMYSRLMEDYLTMCVPQLKVTVRQYGWSGEKVPGFLPRMTNDCLRFNPTIATTCYGMNDFEYRRYEDRIGDVYQTSSTQMVDTFKSHGVRVILGSPGPISKMPHWAQPNVGSVEDLNLSLCQLRNMDIAIADKEDVRFADVFWPMFKANYVGQQEYGINYAIPGNDGVHPHWAGHLIMAYAFLKAMGLNGDIGTFTADLKDGTMQVSSGHKLVSAKDDAFTIESSRYPFCACEPKDLDTAHYPVCGDDPIDSNNSIRSGMTLVPFNQDLNRLTLIVKNAQVARYKVTWGDESKSFSKEQLAQGINLAVEFPQNPFSAAWAKVDAAVATKQLYETQEMKDLFRQTGNDDHSIEQITIHTDKIVNETEKKHAALASAVETAFVPVTHVIKISAED